MNRKITYQDVLGRIGFFRNMSNLSGRETSFRLGKSEQYLPRIENGKYELKVSTLLELCEIFGITIEDFFYLGKDYNPESKEILTLFSNLSKENQQFALDFIKKLQK